MKSFFKKLAFVMALAMVVSLVAPAGTAALADEAGIALQGTKNVITEHSVGIGKEVVDFCFLGAPTDWKTTYVWASNNPAVATVDKAGKVTTLKDGVVNITITAGADGSYQHTVVLTVGKGEVVEDTFTAEMYSDSEALLTFSDTTIEAADVKKNLEFYYYVDGFKVPVPLVEKITDKGNGQFLAKLYDTVTFQDGVVYGFEYGELKDEFTCVIGTVSFAQLLVNGKESPVVEVSEDSHTFSAILKNEAGKDITETALASGVTVEYEVAEDEAGRFTTVDDVSIIFNEPATASVKVTCFVLDEDGERVILVDGAQYYVVATNPTPYDITFNQAANYVITDDTDSVNWTKSLNKKLAVGDEGYALVVKLKDNKGKEVTTEENYIKNGVIDEDAEWDEGSFRFKSTNVSRLYITDEGYLMPNANGSATVLVYYTPAQVGDEKPVEKLVAAIELYVSAPRTVGKTSLTVDNKTLSTVNVNDSNKATVTVKVEDTLQDSIGVEGLEASVECTTTGTNLKDGAKAPALSNAKPKVVDGKFTFTLTADATTVPVAGKSQTYYYKVTIGSKTETFSITVKAPSTTTSFTKYALIFGNAKVEDSKNVNNITLSVGLSGISNGVAAKQLDLAGAKPDKKDAVVGKYYYAVTKDGVDITDKLTGSASGGVLYIDLTTTKTVEYKETKTATAESLTVVDPKFGAGKYAVTVYEVKTDSKGSKYFNPLYGAKDTAVVENALPTVNSTATKLAPEFAGYDVQDAVMNCFQFKIGSTTFEKKDDYTGYKIAINENVVDGGNICFINSVTFYKESKVKGVYIDCGTVTVNDYITFVEE